MDLAVIVGLGLAVCAQAATAGLSELLPGDCKPVKACEPVQKVEPLPPACKPVQPYVPPVKACDRYRKSNCFHQSANR